MSDQQDSPLLEAALRYAASGLHLFPLRVEIIEERGKQKKKCTPVTNWDGQSTTDEARLRGWFGSNGMYRNASIGMDCDKSRKVVVDPDEADGIENWETFRSRHGLGATWRATTPGGGQHWYYQADPERVVGNTTSKIAPKVDTRGGRRNTPTGGFVIMPPSRDDRGAYLWVEGEPEWDQLPVVPVAVVDAVNGESHANGVVARLGQPRRFTQEQAVEFCRQAMTDLRNAPEGTRNDRLNAAAKTLSHFVPAFWSRTEAERLLDNALDPAYPRDEATATIISAFSSAATDWVAEKVVPPEQRTDQWEEPLPLGGSYPPPLPVDTLGQVGAPMVGYTGKSIQVPTCTALTMALPIISTATRGQWKVRVGPDWVESLILCTVAVAPSGERKSPTNRVLTAGLREYEQQLKLEAAPRIARHKARHEMKTKQLDKLREKAARSGEQVDEEMYLEAAEALAADVVEVAPRWLTDDATPEALVRLLSEQDGAIGAISDEAGLFGILAGRYSSGNPNLEAVLQATSGDPILVDRKVALRSKAGSG